MLHFGITAPNSKRQLERWRRQRFLRFLLTRLSESSTLELNLSLKAAEFAPQAREMGLNGCRLHKHGLLGEDASHPTHGATDRANGLSGFYRQIQQV